MHTYASHTHDTAASAAYGYDASKALWLQDDAAFDCEVDLSATLMTPYTAAAPAPAPLPQPLPYHEEPDAAD